MLDVISVENMRKSDAHTIETMTSSIEIMGRAAEGIYASTTWEGHTSIVVGSGNNGGDGFALACLLARDGHSCSVHMIKDKASKSGAHYRELAESAGVPVALFDKSDQALKSSSTFVDCIFGTGFHGTPNGVSAEAIECINSSDAKVVSADINSGLNGENGDAVLAVKSDITVSIGYFKNGMFLHDAARYIGRLVNVEIGIELLGTENRLAVDDAEFEHILDLCDVKPITLSEHEVSELEIEEGIVATGAGNGSDANAEPTTICKTKALSAALGAPLLVRGQSTVYLADKDSVVFYKPDWVVA